jgi:hypothetical protein
MRNRTRIARIRLMTAEKGFHEHRAEKMIGTY